MGKGRKPGGVPAHRGVEKETETASAARPQNSTAWRVGTSTERSRCRRGASVWPTDREGDSGLFHRGAV
jgi:hypothetical protein